MQAFPSSTSLFLVLPRSIFLFFFLFSLVCLFVLFFHSVILLRNPSLGPSTGFPTVISFHSVLCQIYVQLALLWFFFDRAFSCYPHWLWICYPLSLASLVAEITVFATTTGHCCYMVILHFCFFSVLGIYPGLCARQVCYISNSTFCCCWWWWWCWLITVCWQIIHRNVYQIFKKNTESKISQMMRRKSLPSLIWVCTNRESLTLFDLNLRTHRLFTK